MFMNAFSTWIAEIATMEASSFCFSPPKSILVIQSGQSGWPLVSILRDEILVAGEHHDQDQIAGQRDVDQREHAEDDLGLLERRAHAG